MFDPNRQPEGCESYLSSSLGGRVEFIRAERLPQSTREAPWRLDITLEGVPRTYVLQLDPDGIEYEYRALKAVEAIPFPTPRVYGFDPEGEALGTPCFFSDFIAGESLLGPLLAGEAWAEELYLDTVLTLQAVTEADLGAFAREMTRESATDVLETAYAGLKEESLPLAEQVYAALQAQMPALPALRFSNGDLWLDNFIVQNKRLAGVIDFQNAGFSDPVFEFLLSFFVSPELCGRGIEQRYCQRLGVDPALLDWYHGLELFDTWGWCLQSGEGFVHHTAESLGKGLRAWLEH